MPANHVSVVLVHGAWANGSSWSKVNGPLKADGMKVVAAPLPLTSLADDIAALGRVLERLDGPVVLAGHAYGSAVIAETRDPKVASLVYIAGLAPEEGETVGDVFSCGQPHPKAPELTCTGWCGCPTRLRRRLRAEGIPRGAGHPGRRAAPYQRGLHRRSRSSGPGGRTDPAGS